MFGCFECMAGRLLFWACPGLGLRCVFCPGAGGLFSSPLGVSDLSLRHPAGEGFLLGFASGFRWCLAVFESVAGRLLFLGVSWTRLCRVFCPGAGGLFLLLYGFERCHSSPRCDGQVCALFQPSAEVISRTSLWPVTHFWCKCRFITV